ncbi:L-rhamnose mutarotase [Sphingobacterium tabacisoli]|uniref:L-rhamnose mutarotase n=1 Tax=Sphingobacterium tabacisoli TaxID=2044855 RepID=A0ABW5L3L3_9SPHI|nr:L-rhamnose mutarotase [Sphingobacterium tabacisoli]
MKRYALALDLQDNPDLIKEYDEYHRAVWPDVINSIRDSGILSMVIYRFSNRLFMVMDVGDDFSFEKKGEMDANNEKVQEWETLMWKYQRAMPGSRPGEKWVIMDKIFEL